MSPYVRLAFGAPISVAIALVVVYGAPAAWVVAALLIAANLLGYFEGRTRGGWSA